MLKWQIVKFGLFKVIYTTLLNIERDRKSKLFNSITRLSVCQSFGDGEKNCDGGAVLQMLVVMLCMYMANAFLVNITC